MLMQIDGTFVFVVISFLIFLFIIKAVLYRPITRVIEERDNFYAKNSKMETESKEKSKILIEQKEQALSKTRTEAADLIAQTSKKAKEKSAKIIKDEQKDAALKVEENKNLLIQEGTNAKAEVKASISGIVSMIISKLLNEDIQVNVDEKEINEFLKI